MALHRMLPPPNPPNGVATIIITGGRTYTCAVGSTIDVPDFDGLVMASNGWTLCARQGAGPTANRPTAVVKAELRGQEYLDTTLGLVILHDGATWRNPVSGAAV